MKLIVSVFIICCQFLNILAERQCITMIPKLCFNNNHSGNTTLDKWRTVMQFTYGDVEPNIIIPNGFVEGSNRCMNVEATTVCFSEPPLSNPELMSETWTMTDLYFKMPRSWWIFEIGKPRVCATNVENIICFAVSDDEGTHQWSFKVNMLYGNVVPKLGPPNKRVRNYCMKVDESKICFSEQPLLDDFSNKSWKLNKILFNV